MTRYMEHISADKILEMMHDEGAWIIVYGTLYWRKPESEYKYFLRFPDGKSIRLQYSAVNAARKRGYLKRIYGMFGRDEYVLSDPLEVIP